MKIEEQCQSKFKKLNTISAGDVFKIDDEYFMKTNNTCSNAINLKSGELSKFYIDAMVMSIDATLGVNV